MADPVSFMVKINGSPALIDDLKSVADANATQINIESLGPADQASHLRLGLTEVATIVTVVNGVATFAKFAWTIYQHFKDKKSEQMTVQTPLRTIVILGSDAVSPERVQALLEETLRA
jgi:hypothetical protein